jgi:hypothetical protein
MADAANRKARRTTMVAVTTMEEAAILSEKERAEMIRALKAAEARIAAGQYVEHDPETFMDRLMEVRAAEIRNRKG